MTHEKIPDTIPFFFNFCRIPLRRPASSPNKKAALTVNYLTDQDGLPNYTVYKIFKDSRNMMWIGTFNGICRFDGHSFTKFHIDLPKPLNAVTDIVETHEGHIMFGTRKGLYLVEPERQTCVQVCPPNLLCQLYRKNRTNSPHRECERALGI